MRPVSLRGLPGLFWTLFAGTLINRLGTLVGPFLALYLTQSMGLSATHAGFAISCWGAGGLAAGFLGGILADHVGRRPTLLLSFFGGGATMLLLGFVEDPAWIPALVALLGFLGEMYRPAVSAIVADVVRPEDRLRAYGLLYWAVNLGFSIASVVAGFLARSGFSILFLIDGATTIAFGLIVWWRVPETRVARAGSQSSRTSLAAPFRDTVFMAFAVLLLGLGFAFNHISVSLPLTMNARGLLPEDYGMAMAVNGVLIILIQPFVGRTVGAFRPAHVLAAAALLTGLGLGAHSLSQTTFHFGIAVAIWTLGEIAMVPVFSSVVAELAPADARGRYQGVTTMVGGLGSLAAPMVGALILERAGAPTLWMASLAASVAVALGYLFLNGPLERRRAAGRVADLDAAVG